MRRLPLRAVVYLTSMAALLMAGRSPAQTPPIEGLHENTPNVHALVNVRIVPAPGRSIEKGTIVVRDGTIEAVGPRVAVPADARVWDYEGMTVYPGLIELYSHLGLAKEKGNSRRDSAEEEIKGAVYWNRKVTPQRNVLESFDPKKKDIDAMRSLGFTSALIVPDKGVIGGASALVSLGDGDVNEREIDARTPQCMSLVHEFEGFDNIAYPTALMGQIALIRQALLDAQWYGAARRAYALNPSQERPETNDALQALYDDLVKRSPVLCVVDDDLDVLRAQKIAAEFDLDMWVRGSGHEYRIAGALKRSGTKVIVPVNYPEAPDVSTPEKALDATLVTLRHWDTAPANAALLEAAGVEFALTAAGLEKSSEFHERVRRAIDRGLSEKQALAALTTVPARMLGLEKTLGTIERGKSAHLVVADGDLFAKKTKVVDLWIDGNVYEVKKRPEVDPRGTWQITLREAGFGDDPLTLEISGEIEKLKGKIRRDTTEVTLKKVELELRRLALSFSGDDLGIKGVVRMTGVVEKKSLAGQGELPDGEWFAWQGAPGAAEKPQNGGKPEEPSETKAHDVARAAGYGAYSLDARPAQPKHVLVRDATLWTSGPQGTLTGADMLVTRGRISKIGRGLKAPPGAVVIDAKGKHVTPGLIDCHSHTGMTGGANEFGQPVSAEVRVADIVDPRNIGFYRELAGGLTVANILHGSANPIGGQNAVVKLRWGASPDEMIIEDAAAGIKFALGENVKRSNWSNPSNRYPQTRMGVEQIIRDRFKAARDYEQAWKEFSSTRNKKGLVPPRRDLELEALLEVLRGERLVHCHSYRQDEILMLVRVAEDFGFRIGTFQHVLEGYKVAEAIAAHGAGASTFSDWWAYKFEVYDAIPYNGALMYGVGVVVSFNSDSSELARRMNLEAAKAVKYGGVPEDEALKFVTLNPAKQLRIDHRVGSLEVGKDGDFVVWSGSPLSTYTRCEQTWIDGRKFFDIEHDRELRAAIADERAQLVQKALAPVGSDDEGKRGKGAGSSEAAVEEDQND